jgi:CheY-like chemotaxis protein
VVDDEPETRRALRQVLEVDRYEVRDAAGGMEALGLVEAFSPDLVVMDWRMPGLSGARLCRRIRARPHPPPIVVVSSADEAFESGEDIVAALHKPVDVEELRLVVASELAAG